MNSLSKHRKTIIALSGLTIAILLTLIPSSAQANAGVPMIYFLFPPLKIAIIPIILIEALIYQKLLDLDLKQAFLCSTIANLISTLAGFPLLWGAIVGVGSIFGFLKLYTVGNVILFPAWLGPLPNEKLLYLVPLSAAVFLVIAYFVSIAIEKLATRKLLEKLWKKTLDQNSLQKSVQIANLATYIPLGVFMLLKLYLDGLQFVNQS